MRIELVLCVTFGVFINSAFAMPYITDSCPPPGQVEILQTFGDPSYVNSVIDCKEHNQGDTSTCSFHAGAASMSGLIGRSISVPSTIFEMGEDLDSMSEPLIVFLFYRRMGMARLNPLGSAISVADVKAVHDEIGEFAVSGMCDSNDIRAQMLLGAFEPLLKNFQDILKLFETPDAKVSVKELFLRTEQRQAKIPPFNIYNYNKFESIDEIKKVVLKHFINSKIPLNIELCGKIDENGKCKEGHALVASGVERILCTNKKDRQIKYRVKLLDSGEEEEHVYSDLDQLGGLMIKYFGNITAIDYCGVSGKPPCQPGIVKSDHQDYQLALKGLLRKSVANGWVGGVKDLLDSGAADILSEEDKTVFIKLAKREMKSQDSNPEKLQKYKTIRSILKANFAAPLRSEIRTKLQKFRENRQVDSGNNIVVPRQDE